MSETARETVPKPPVNLSAAMAGQILSQWSYADSVPTSEWNELFRAITAALEERDREIDRLKAGGCARDQRTTQFCAEAVALKSQLDEAVRLLELAERSLGNESPGIAGHRKQVEIRGAIAAFLQRVKGGKS